MSIKIDRRSVAILIHVDLIVRQCFFTRNPMANIGRPVKIEFRVTINGRDAPRSLIYPLRKSASRIKAGITNL